MIGRDELLFLRVGLYLDNGLQFRKERAESNRNRLTGFPFTTHGTSKGSSCFIVAIAASSSRRCPVPGAYVLCRG